MSTVGVSVDASRDITLLACVVDCDGVMFAFASLEHIQSHDYLDIQMGTAESASIGLRQEISPAS